MKVGGALGTPTSFCQSPATRPLPDSVTSTRKKATMAMQTMPTLSERRRRQEAAHTPSERCAGLAAAVLLERTALISGLPPGRPKGGLRPHGGL
jgi:hypothetical protein